MAFGLDDALMIATILSATTSAASQMGAFGSPGSGGMAAGRPTVGKTQQFQLGNPFLGRPMGGATGKLSENLTQENNPIPKYGASPPMSPYQQNDMNMKLLSATRGK